MVQCLETTQLWHVQNEAWNCLAERCHLDGRLCFYSPNIFLHVNGPFTIMQVTHTVCNDAPQHQDRCLLLFCTCRWWKSGWSLLSLGVRTRFHFLPKTRWNMASSEHIRLFHFLLDHLRSQAQRTRRHLHIRTDVKLSPWVLEMRVAFLDAASDCVQWKWFAKLLLSTCGCISQSSMMVPTQTEISLDSLNLVTMFWMEDDERHKCFTISQWEMWFFFFDNSLRIVGTKSHLDPFWHKKTEKYFYYQTWYPQLITNSPAHFGLFQNSRII